MEEDALVSAPTSFLPTDCAILEPPYATKKVD